MHGELFSWLELQVLALTLQPQWWLKNKKAMRGAPAFQGCQFPVELIERLPMKIWLSDDICMASASIQEFRLANIFQTHSLTGNVVKLA